MNWAWDFVSQINGDLSGVLVEQRDVGDTPKMTTLFVASTNAEDRAMDVVVQDWTNLDQYLANPVILDNHDTTKVVGRARSATMVGGQLQIDVEWDLTSPVDTIANVGHQHLKGIRRAGSVGFRPGQTTPRNKLPKSSPYYRDAVKVQTYFGEIEIAGNLYEGNSLLEFSSATIPMNPEALQRSVVGRGAAPPSPLIGLARSCTSEQLAELAGLLWPGQLELARTDPTFRRILRAQLEAAPPPAPAAAPINFAGLVLAALET